MAKRKKQTRDERREKLENQVRLLQHIVGALVRANGGSFMLDCGTMEACEDGHVDMQINRLGDVSLHYVEPPRRIVTALS